MPVTIHAPVKNRDHYPLSFVIFSTRHLAFVWEFLREISEPRYT